jgi:hypothetical protein
MRVDSPHFLLDRGKKPRSSRVKSESTFEERLEIDAQLNKGRLPAFTKRKIDPQLPPPTGCLFCILHEKSSRQTGFFLVVCAAFKNNRKCAFSAHKPLRSWEKSEARSASAIFCKKCTFRWAKIVQNSYFRAFSNSFFPKKCQSCYAQIRRKQKRFSCLLVSRRF